MKYNIINDIKYYMFHYSKFLEFMSEVAEQIKNDEDTKSCYLSNFKKYEEQVINSEYSYLKKYDYYMHHYDNPSKKKICSLTKDDILKIIIIDDEYTKIIRHGIETKGFSHEGEKLIEILDKYNYPKEFALGKTAIDFIRTSLKISKY
jgi:hypothetical protein